jgi:hypothetical protein
MNGLTNLRKHLNRPVTLMTLTAAILAGLSGCRTAQPILESVIVRDTVIVTDTKYLIDTLEVMKDTVIYQDKVRLQLQYIDRKVVVEATCLPDTIRVTQTKILTKQEPKVRKWTLESMLFGLAFVLTIVYLLKRWVDKITE